MDSKLTSLKRSVAARIAKLSTEQAKEKFAAYQAESTSRMFSMHNDVIKELTGGYNSQSLNAWVVRKLATRAGLVKEAR